jgi:hypothetical protein
MKADEIRNIPMTPEEAPFWEIAAQLATLNEHCNGGGFPIQIVGAVPTDIHGIFVAISKFARKKGKD